jgi:hypothetical protein
LILGYEKEKRKMAANDYHFITHWRVQGTAQEVIEIMADAPSLTRWWTSVYLDVQELAKGDANGIGKRVSLYTKGWLPYTLRWQFRVTEATADTFTLVAEGDFEGRGIWTFAQDGDYVDITYDWLIAANKPILKTISFILKPLFSMNHLWAMQQGEISLKLELLRRHANEAERHALPAPPRPTPNHPLQWLIFVASGQQR